jgi:hypothetical protein
MASLPKNFMQKGRQVAISSLGAKKTKNTTAAPTGPIAAIKKPNSSATNAKKR